MNNPTKFFMSGGKSHFTLGFTAIFIAERFVQNKANMEQVGRRPLLWLCVVWPSVRCVAVCAVAVAVCAVAVAFQTRISPKGTRTTPVVRLRVHECVHECVHQCGGRWVCGAHDR